MYGARKRIRWTKQSLNQKLSTTIRDTEFEELITLVESDVLVWINCQPLFKFKKIIFRSKLTELYNPIKGSLSSHRNQVSTYGCGKKISPQP